MALVSVFFFLSYCGGQVFFFYTITWKNVILHLKNIVWFLVYKRQSVCIFFIARVRDLYSFFLGKIEIIFQFPKNLFIYGGNRARAPVTKKGFTSHSHLYFFKVFQEVVLLR